MINWDNWDYILIGSPEHWDNILSYSMENAAAFSEAGYYPFLTMTRYTADYTQNHLKWEKPMRDPEVLKSLKSLDFIYDNFKHERFGKTWLRTKRN